MNIRVITEIEKEKTRLYQKKYQAEHREYLSAQHKAWYAANQEDHKEKCRIRYAKNRQKYAEAAKRYCKKHLKKINEYRRVWAAENPEKQKAITHKANAKRYATLQGKLRSSIGARVRLSLANGSKGRRHWEDLVGFTLDQLKRHLGKQFKPGMTWDNYGSYWQIDHKIPVAVFNFTTCNDLDFKRCWALRNLQPLEVKKNQSKGAKIDKPFQPSLAI